MHPRIPVTLALLLSAGPAGAVELIAGWDVEGVWDSNVLRQNEGLEDSDLSMRTGPDLTIREQQGDLTYELRTQARYENFGRLDSLDTDKITDFDYFASGNATWQATSRTTLSISDSFARTNSLSAFLESDPTGLIDPTSPEFVSTIRAGRTRFGTNDASATLTHALGPRWVLNATAQHSIFDPADEQEVDSNAIVASIQLTRALTRRLTFGANASIQRNDSIFDGETLSGNLLYRGGAVVKYQVSRNMRFEMNAGPGYSLPDDPPSEQAAATYIAVDPSTCDRDSDGIPVFRSRLGSSRDSAGGCARSQYRAASSTRRVVPGQFGAPVQELVDIDSVTEPVEGSLSYYGSIRLIRDWRLWHAEVSFDRSQNNRSVGGTPTINTSLSTQVRWLPTQKWTVTLNGTYSLQTSAFGGQQFETLIALRPDTSIVPTFPGVTVDPVGVPFEYRSGEKLGDEEATFTTWRLELRAERRISRNLTLDGSASYYRQISDNEGASFSGDDSEPRETQIIRVILGLTWKFDPIPL